MKWNYEIYTIADKDDHELGKADIIDFERLLPLAMFDVVMGYGRNSDFKMEVVTNGRVYKVWR